MSKKARMNRGLDALFSDNYTPQQEQDQQEVNSEPDKKGITTVSISLVEPNKGQPRKDFDEEKIAELAGSIKENGILQPILVTPLENGGYRIVAGERRWRAARAAGLKEVPVFVKDLTDKQVMQLALIENIQRQDLTPIEEAMAYKQLMDTYSMTQQELAKAVGKSRSAIANSLRLLDLCDKVKQLLVSGQITSGHAKVLAGISDEKIQIEAAELAANQELSVRKLEEQVKRMTDPLYEIYSKGKGVSLVHDDPFLKEFEITVNDNSNIKADTKVNGNGEKFITFKIPKDVEINDMLSQIADIIVKY